MFESSGCLLSNGIELASPRVPASQVGQVHESKKLDSFQLYVTHTAKLPQLNKGKRSVALLLHVQGG